MKQVIMMLVAVLCLSGCASIKPVKQIEYRDNYIHDSIYITKHIKDSVYVKDSTAFKALGDTIYIEKYKYIYKEKTRLDTIYESCVDSIYIDKLEVKEVEKRLNKFQIVSMMLGWLLIIIVGWKLFKRFRL